jgi:hypothetical protein
VWSSNRFGGPVVRYNAVRGTNNMKIDARYGSGDNL